MFGVTQEVADRQDPRADERWAETALPLILIGGVLLKLALAALLGHLSPDNELLKAWCMRIARTGPFSFFDLQDIPNVAPGALHPLAALLLYPFGLAWRVFDPSFLNHGSALFTTWVRIPAILADAVAYIAIYRIARRYIGPRKALTAAALVYLNPVTLLTTAVWGGTDGLILALLAWGVHAILAARIPLGVALVGCAGLVHVHALVVLPIALAFASNRGGGARTALGAGAALVALLGLGFLFAPHHPHDLYLSQLTAERYTTYHAFNVWYPLGNLENGSTPLFPALPLSRHLAGGLILAALVAMGAFRAATRENDSDLLRELFLIALGGFLFSTRVHARYVLYPLAVLALFPGHRGAFWLLTISGALNVIWPLGLSSNWGQAVVGGWGNFLAAWHLVLFLRLAMQGTDASEEELHFKPYKLQDDDNDGPTWLRPESGIVRLDRTDLLLMLVFMLAFGFLRHYRLATPEDMIFDEIYHARAGEEIYAGKAPNEWVHPPLAKLLIGLGIKQFGMNSYGWRFLPWLAGCLVLPFLYVLARNILPDRRGAAIATLLLGLDGCFFVLSRTAMTNVFAVLFQLSAVTFFLLYLKQASVENGKLGHGSYLFATAVCAGLGISTRWTCLWLIAFLAATYGLHTVWAFYKQIHTRTLYPSHKILAFIAATISGILHFILLPGAMYLASYYPLVKGGAYADYHYVVSLQPQIWNFHTTFTTHHPYYSQWYTWCWTYRPVWYHYKEVEGQIYGILAMGNPLLWWISTPAVALAAWYGLRKRSWLALYACGWWAALYLPWILSPRVLNYSHYYLEPLPYACIAIAWLLSELYRRDRSFWLETIVIVLMIALTFAFFYPIYACAPLPRKTYDFRIWSRNWI